MSGVNKTNAKPSIIMPMLVIAALALSALACELTASATEAPPLPTEVEAATAVPEAAATEVMDQPETEVEVDLGEELIGFWRSKIVGKQVIVFEFQANGLTVWHYRYNNGQKKDNSGTYSVEEGKVVVNFGEPQELMAQLDGTTLTLTGADGKPLVLQKTASVDDPGLSASKNIAQDIVNRWQDAPVNEWIEFKADGKVSIQSSGGDLNGTYSISGNTLTMKLDNQEKSSSFVVEIDGDVLTLYAEDGSFIDYVK